MPTRDIHYLGSREAGSGQKRKLNISDEHSLERQLHSKTRQRANSHNFAEPVIETLDRQWPRLDTCRRLA